MIKDIEKFFEDRKAVISKHSLCKEAGITTQLLGMIFRGEREFTDNVQMRLLPVLEKYGFESSLLLARSGNALNVLKAVFVELSKTGFTGEDIPDIKAFNKALSKCNQEVVDKFRQLNNFQLDYARNFIAFDLNYANKLTQSVDEQN